MSGFLYLCDRKCDILSLFSLLFSLTVIELYIVGTDSVLQLCCVWRLLHACLQGCTVCCVCVCVCVCVFPVSCFLLHTNTGPSRHLESNTGRNSPGMPVCTYRAPKNFHDKILSRISRILQYRESFFRKILVSRELLKERSLILLSSHALLRSTRNLFSRNGAAERFAKVFCCESF